MSENTNFLMVPESRYQFLISLEQATKVRKSTPDPDADLLLTVEQLRDYLLEKTSRRPATQTVYDLVCKRKIPAKKFSKFLYFQRSAIDNWLANGRQLR